MASTNDDATNQAALAVDAGCAGRVLVGLALIWLLPADERTAAYGGVLALAYTAVLICLFALRSAPRAMPVGLGFLWGMPASAVMMIVAFVLRP